MSFKYSYVLPPTGAAENSTVREMFDDIQQYVNSFIPSGGAAPYDASYLTLATNATLINERVLTAGTGIQFTDNGAGSTLVVTNNGVTSITGTANQVIASAATGAVTLSLPQNIGTGSSVQFSRLLLDPGTLGTPSLYWANSGNPIGFDMGVASNIRLAINSTEIANFSSSGSRFTGFASSPKLILTNSSQLELTVASTAGYSLQFPAADGSNTYSLTTDGSGHLSFQLRAKADLSNLASTAVNVSIIPAVPGTIDIGNTTFPWANLIANAVVITQASPGTHFSSFISSPSMSSNAAYVLPVDDGSVNQVLTTDGSGVLSWSAGTGAGAATQQLDNLLTVAINTSLLPASNNAIDLGSSSKEWRTAYLKTSLIFQETGAGTHTITIQAPSSLAASYTLTLPVDDGTPNQILQTDGSGVLSWTTAPAGSATIALDNLVSVAINTSLLPASTDSINLGSYTKSWASIYVGNSLILIDPFNTSTGNTVAFSAANGTDAIIYTLPPNDGNSNQYLTTNGSGVLTWTNAAGTGTVNSGTANQLAYYASSTNAVSGLTAITGNRAIVSNASGLPIAATTTDTEIGYVSGVTSAIQTQLGLKAPLASPTFTGTVTVPTLSVTNTSTHFTLSTSSQNLILQASTQATSARTWSIPDISGNGTFAALEGSQTFSGTKTFSSDVNISATKKLFLDGGSNTYLVESSGDVIDIYTGGNLAKRIDASGDITQPLQSSFLVVDGTGASNVTGDGTIYTELWPTEIYDQGGNFASNTFTAPVTGRYFLQASVAMEQILTAHTRTLLILTTSNRAYRNDQIYTTASDAFDLITRTISVIADMDAGDTATVGVFAGGSTKTVDVTADAKYNYFSGSLIN